MDDKPIDFLSGILTPEQLAKVRKAKPVTPPAYRSPNERVLDYSASRPEVTNVRVVDGPLPIHEQIEGTVGEPFIDSSSTRPELKGPSVVDQVKALNRRTLDELKRDYLTSWEAWKQGKIAMRPVWAANGAVDLAEQLRAHGPSVADPPPIDLVTPRV